MSIGQCLVLVVCYYYNYVPKLISKSSNFTPRRMPKNLSWSSAWGPEDLSRLLDTLSRRCCASLQTQLNLASQHTRSNHHHHHQRRHDCLVVVIPLPLFIRSRTHLTLAQRYKRQSLTTTTTTTIIIAIATSSLSSHSPSHLVHQRPVHLRPCASSFLTPTFHRTILTLTRDPFLSLSPFAGPRNATLSLLSRA